MNSKFLLSIGIAICTSSNISAFADHHSYYGHGHGHGRGHGHAYGHSKKYYKKHYSWNQERDLYKRNWSRINTSQRSRYDAQMRSQWLAYHHNQWNGSYDWNNYNDPAFLDYLHSRNPNLLNSIRGILGF